MQVNVGTKATNPMPNGLAWPSLCISEPVSEVTTVVNKSTGQPVEITITRADFISLRENLAGEAYLSLTTETVQYGYRPIAMPRFDNVVGLDVDADGAKITLGELLKAHAATYAEFSARMFEQRRGAVAAEDI
jgi:hypothetical protein